MNAIISTLPKTNKEGKRVRYIPCASLIIEIEIDEDLPSTADNTIQDDDKIRDIDETQPLETEDTIAIDDNDEALPVPTEDTIIINDNNDTDPLATVDIINSPDNVQTPEADPPSNHPHQYGRLQDRPLQQTAPPGL
jgi:hypothetical protein